MKRISIKWKIFSYLICFCTLLLLILWLFQTVFLDTFYRTVKIMEIKSFARQISLNIDDQSMLYKSVLHISHNYDCYVEILDNKGMIILASGDKKNSLPPYEKMNILDKLYKEEYIEYFSNEFPKDTIGQQYPIKKPMQSIVYLKRTNNHIILINTMISPVDATVKTLRYQLYLVTFIMIILAILLALFIAKRVSKPIEKLNNSAKVLAKGIYEITFSDDAYKEIAELSDTLNITAIELNKVEKLRRELMANISHDLRTPLSLIYGYEELMQDFPEDITAKQTQVIMDETRRLSLLVNDIFDISNFEAGIQTLNIRIFNITENIKKTTERVAELVKNDGYTITFEYDRDVLINADEIKLTQAFYNLLINAINYTGNDRIVKIRQFTNDKTITIEVIDTGEGISEENLKYIWDRYYKIEKNHKRYIAGTGLGLSIVKKIIELHNGQYGVTSKENEGSTFRFILNI